MVIKYGIVGLPNVGKSTFFNKIVGYEKAQSANYPFCTIDPNSAYVTLVDPRLEKISSVMQSKKISFAKIEIIDIAGLIKNAHKGEGLGNQFLETIRTVNGIIHCVRLFHDEDITHVEGSVNPLRDINTIQTELYLSDKQIIDSHLNSKKTTFKEEKEKIREIDKKLDELINGYSYTLEREHKDIIKKMNLLSFKPVLYLGNTSSSLESKIYKRNFIEIMENNKKRYKIISLKNRTNADNKNQYLSLGLSLMQLTNWIHFFTVGPKEARAWTVPKNSTAQLCAQKIHTDISRGFIAADVVHYDNFVKWGNECRKKGKIKSEGKKYIVQDGDIINFKFNV